MYCKYPPDSKSPTVDIKANFDEADVPGRAEYSENLCNLIG